MKDYREDGDCSKENGHGSKGLFEGVKMKYFDAPHADESCQEVIVNPVLKEEGKGANGKGQKTANEVAHPDEFEDSAFKFVGNEQEFIEAKKGKRDREDDAKVPDDQKSLPRLIVTQFQKDDNGCVSESTEYQEGNPPEFKSKRFQVYSDRPDVGVHCHSNDDSPIDHCDENIPYFKLFVPVRGVTVQQETESYWSFDRNGDFIEVVAGVVGLGAIHAEFEGRTVEVWNIGLRFWIGRHSDGEERGIWKLNIRVVKNDQIWRVEANHLEVIVSAVQLGLENSIIEGIVQLILRKNHPIARVTQNLFVYNLDPRG